MRRLWLGAVLITGCLWCLLLSGCSKDPAALANVHGTVFFRGAPVQGGTIVFAPDPTRGGNGPLAFAEIKTDGSYRLQTGDTMGATPGWHRVTIAAHLQMENQIMRIPATYCDPELSGQRIEVKAGHDNSIDLHLD